MNFVGKILGQGGENVKRLQEMAGCRIAVLGRGSMKDKNKVRGHTLSDCAVCLYYIAYNKHQHSSLSCAFCNIWHCMIRF